MDPETVERARRGDARAIETLLEGVTPRLIRLARRISGDAEAAEDLVEEALYRGAVKLRDLREAAAVTAWFCRILINLWRDRLRIAGRRELLLDEIPEPVASPDTDPVLRADARELRERVADAMRRLPPGQRAAIALRVDEGLAIQEIARILDSTPDRVKANLWHARERLRRELRDLLESPRETEQGP
ncbi:MAG: RNA polymerase sigma factor [Planctomycetes bacterium]|nr:RNA polymerase sigma factor [Planctomycetota bacterium]